MPPAQVTDRPDSREDQHLERGVRDNSVRANWRLLAITFYMGIALFEYGFDKGAIAGFQAMPGFLMLFGYQTPEGHWAIHAGPQQIISSFMILGSFIGSLMSGPIGAYLSRRYSIMLGCALMIVCIVLMALTTSMAALYVSRLLTGISNGMLLSFTLVYLQECASSHFRGLCFGMATIWITIGTTIGMVINNATAEMLSRKAYQIPLYVCFAAPVIMIITLPFLHESPRWLLHHGKPEEALRSLRFFRHDAYDEIAIQQEFEEMKAIAVREAGHRRDGRLFLTAFQGCNLRRTIICVGVGMANAGVGAMFVLAFGTYFFQIAEVGDPFKWIIITNCIGLIGIIGTWFAVTRIGRRIIILTGCSICTVCMLIMAVIYSSPNVSKENAGIALVIVFSVYVFGFNFGLEPYVYLVAGEMPSQQLRAYTLGFSNAVSFAFAWLCAFTTPYYLNPAELNWGPKYGYIWFGSGLVVTLFVYFALPEVRGRTLEEIDEMFMKGVPRKDFQTYVCEDREEAKSKALATVLKDKPEAMHIEHAS